MNVLEFERGKTIRKIKALEKYQKDYKAIQDAKKRYINALRTYSTYATINIELHRVQQEVNTLEAQLSEMAGKLLLLRKEL